MNRFNMMTLLVLYVLVIGLALLVGGGSARRGDFHCQFGV